MTNIGSVIMAPENLYCVNSENELPPAPYINISSMQIMNLRYHLMKV